MSLYVDVEASQQCLEWMMADGGKRTVWKRVRLEVRTPEEGDEPIGSEEILDALLLSPIQNHFSWEPGWVEADGEEICLISQLQLINGGAIHVYFNKPPESILGGLVNTEVLMPLTVYAEDFIAAGGYPSRYRTSNSQGSPSEVSLLEACFRKVYLSYGDAEMTVKEATERWRQGGGRQPTSTTSQVDLAKQQQMLFEAQIRAQKDNMLFAAHTNKTEIDKYYNLSIQNQPPPRTASEIHALQQQVAFSSWQLGSLIGFDPGEQPTPKRNWKEKLQDIMDAILLRSIEGTDKS
jgi:hypothetical protein